MLEMSRPFTGSITREEPKNNLKNILVYPLIGNPFVGTYSLSSKKFKDPTTNNFYALNEIEGYIYLSKLGYLRRSQDLGTWLNKYNMTESPVLLECNGVMGVTKHTLESAVFKSIGTKGVRLPELLEDTLFKHYASLSEEELTTLLTTKVQYIIERGGLTICTETRYYRIVRSRVFNENFSDVYILLNAMLQNNYLIKNVSDLVESIVDWMSDHEGLVKYATLNFIQENDSAVVDPGVPPLELVYTLLDNLHLYINKDVSDRQLAHIMFSLPTDIVGDIKTYTGSSILQSIEKFIDLVMPNNVDKNEYLNLTRKALMLVKGEYVWSLS